MLFKSKLLKKCSIDFDLVVCAVKSRLRYIGIAPTKYCEVTENFKIPRRRGCMNFHTFGQRSITLYLFRQIFKMALGTFFLKSKIISSIYKILPDIAFDLEII